MYIDKYYCLLQDLLRGNTRMIYFKDYTRK